MKTTARAKSTKKNAASALAGRTIMRGFPSKRQRQEAAQKRRMRIAGITIVFFFCGCLLLALSGAWEKSTVTTSAAEYLFYYQPESKADPLQLSERVAGVTLTGISTDGSVIGYASDLSPDQVVMQLQQALLFDGWVLIDDNGYGILSFKRESLDATGGSGLFIQCVSVNQGSSIVVQRW